MGTVGRVRGGDEVRFGVFFTCTIAGYCGLIGNRIDGFVEILLRFRIPVFEMLLTTPRY